ncbi:IS5 family transposase [Amycolatopsis azurea DSM 43854]|uniref:IS5 family transposase n=1 Tax=Amycolatopsis azurea DSM 43854 TaxID=1238180 RepID=A0ABX3J4Q2_9PSEU|nr:IS5 family transposase [Amycolatopsis azurea DSM 43854]
MVTQRAAYASSLAEVELPPVRRTRCPDNRGKLNERTGAPWRDLPEQYGSWKTAHERLRKWTADGTWDRILEHVIVKDDSLGTLEDNVEFVVSVDSTSVRAHQHAAGARKKGAARTGSKTSPSTANASDDHAED